MDFNERFITGPDNQGPWPLLGPASVYFVPRGWRASETRRPEKQRAIAGGSDCLLGQKYQAPIANRGLDLIPDAVFQTPSG